MGQRLQEMRLQIMMNEMVKEHDCRGGGGRGGVEVSVLAEAGISPSLLGWCHCWVCGEFMMLRCCLVGSNLYSKEASSVCPFSLVCRFRHSKIFSKLSRAEQRMRLRSGI